MTTQELDQAAQMLARWLAPYVAAELRGDGGGEAASSATYDGATVTTFVRALGHSVVTNALVFFEKLAADGEATSVDIAEALSVGSPRNIAAVLTTPLKRRAKALGLPNPWSESSRGDRTLWIDRDGLAKQFVTALRREAAQRGLAA